MTLVLDLPLVYVAAFSDAASLPWLAERGAGALVRCSGAPFYTALFACADAGDAAAVASVVDAAAAAGDAVVVYGGDAGARAACVLRYLVGAGGRTLRDALSAVLPRVGRAALPPRETLHELGVLDYDTHGGFSVASAAELELGCGNGPAAAAADADGSSDARRARRALYEKGAALSWGGGGAADASLCVARRAAADCDGLAAAAAASAAELCGWDPSLEVGFVRAARIGAGVALEASAAAVPEALAEHVAAGKEEDEDEEAVLGCCAALHGAGRRRFERRCEEVFAARLLAGGGGRGGAEEAAGGSSSRPALLRADRLRARGFASLAGRLRELAGPFVHREAADADGDLAALPAHLWESLLPKGLPAGGCGGCPPLPPALAALAERWAAEHRQRKRTLRVLWTLGTVELRQRGGAAGRRRGGRTLRLPTPAAMLLLEFQTEDVLERAVLRRRAAALPDAIFEGALTLLQRVPKRRPLLVASEVAGADVVLTLQE